MWGICVSYLSSENTVSVIQISELAGRDWNVGRIARDFLLRSAKSAGFDQLFDLSEPIEPSLCIEPGSIFFSGHKSRKSITLVRKKGESPRSGFTNLDETVSLLIDSSGNAYTALGLGAEVIFDGNFSAFRMKSTDSAIWTWAWLNYGFQTTWSSVLSELAKTSTLPGRHDLDLLISKHPTRFASEYEKFLELAYQVNTEIWDEEEEKSSYGSRSPRVGSRWELREIPESLAMNHGLSLGTLVKEVLPGKGLKSELQDGLPSTGGNWIRNGEISAFQDPLVQELVLASPGDVISPSIGFLSQARVVEETMAVASGHYLLVMNDGVTPGAVADFLNSRIANQMRKHAVQSAINPRITKSDLLKFTFVETKNYSSALRNLMEKLVVE
jgi:hypothetical protein